MKDIGYLYRFVYKKNNTCPLFSQMASTSPSTALSRSAESKTTKGDFPPRCTDNFLPLPAVARRKLRPACNDDTNPSEVIGCCVFRKYLSLPPETQLRNVSKYLQATKTGGACNWGSQQIPKLKAGPPHNISRNLDTWTLHR